MKRGRIWNKLGGIGGKMTWLSWGVNMLTVSLVTWSAICVGDQVGDLVKDSVKDWRASVRVSVPIGRITVGLSVGLLIVYLVSLL